jgi:hypothetical protein
MRRYVTPGVDAAVWCPSGRWGPKRVRVTRCWATLKAESVYTGLLRDNPARMTARAGVRSPARGSLEWKLPGRPGEWVEWELRPNAVWRFGRLFLRCPKCSRPATRIYVPAEDAEAACRRCWGLTYESRQERNYKAGRSPLAAIGISPIGLAYSLAETARVLRAEAAAKRYAERREILKRQRT